MTRASSRRLEATIAFAGEESIQSVPCDAPAPSLSSSSSPCELIPAACARCALPAHNSQRGEGGVFGRAGLGPGTAELGNWGCRGRRQSAAAWARRP